MIDIRRANECAEDDLKGVVILIYFLPSLGCMLLLSVCLLCVCTFLDHFTSKKKGGKKRHGKQKVQLRRLYVPFGCDRKVKFFPVLITYV